MIDTTLSLNILTMSLNKFNYINNIIKKIFFTILDLINPPKNKLKKSIYSDNKINPISTNKFKKINTKIINDSESDNNSISYNKLNKNFKKSEKSEDSADSEVEKSEDSAESEVENSEKESDKDSLDELIKADNININKIYEFVKKTLKNKNLNQITLKKICEMYWNKTKNYVKSIELYQLEVQNKTFKKTYKEINVKK